MQNIKSCCVKYSDNKVLVNRSSDSFINQGPSAIFTVVERRKMMKTWALPAQRKHTGRQQSFWMNVEIYYAAQLWLSECYFQKSMQKREQGSSKAGFGLYCLQSVWSAINSSRSRLSSVHCKHNGQTASRSALYCRLTGVWRVCWALSRVWGAEHLQGHRAVFVCAYLGCQHITNLCSVRVNLRFWGKWTNAMRKYEIWHTPY